jgi:hypothetical protein
MEIHEVPDFEQPPQDIITALHGDKGIIQARNQAFNVPQNVSNAVAMLYKFSTVISFQLS